MSTGQWVFLIFLGALLVGAVLGGIGCRRGLRVLDSLVLEGRNDEAERPVPW